MNTTISFNRFGSDTQVVMLDYGFSSDLGEASAVAGTVAAKLPQVMAWCPASGLVLMKVSGGSQMIVALPEIQIVGGGKPVPSPSETLSLEYAAELKSSGDANFPKPPPRPEHPVFS